MRLINSDSQVTDARVIARDGSTATAIRFDAGPVILIAVAALLVVIAGCGVVMGLTIGRYQTLIAQSAKTEQEARMLQYYVNELDGKLIHAGFIEPRERWSPAKKQELQEKHP